MVQNEILDKATPCALNDSLLKYNSLESDQYNLVKNFMKFHGFDKSANSTDGLI